MSLSPFSSDEFVEQAIEYGKQSKDWVYEKINANDGSEENVREMFASLQQKNIKLREKIGEYGYQYFTTDNKSFTDYKIEVTNFLLEDF